MFSAVATTFIVQIIPSLQPNPSDLTNVLLLRILQQNHTFGGTDPLEPVMNASYSVVQAQVILFASLAVTLFVAFIAVLGKQWILYYSRASTWGSIADRGKERQLKLLGVERWGLHFIIESLPVFCNWHSSFSALALRSTSGISTFPPPQTWCWRSLVSAARSTALSPRLRRSG